MSIYLGNDLVNLRNNTNLLCHIGYLSSLPREYQEVEYLESSQTQWIDTDFIPNQNTSIETKVSIPTTEGRWWFGTRQGSLEKEFGMYRGTSGSTIGQDVVSCYGNDRQTLARGTFSGDTVIIKREKNIDTFENNGNTYTLTHTTNSFTCPYTLYLFNIHLPTVITESAVACKMYYFKIWDNNTLVRNFIPCYRKSDRKPGLYDVVNDRFYTNVGTGEFLLPQRLPSAYQEVRWIKPISGIPYIDTGIFGSNNINLKIKAKLYRTDNNACLIGMRSTSFNSGAKDITIATEGGIPCIYYQHVGQSGYKNITPDAIYNVKTTSTKLIDDNTGETMITLPEPAIWGASKNFYIGCLNNNGVAERPFYGEIYQVEIYDNDDLVKQLVPCYHRIDGTIGMYDLKNNTFHYQRGTGSFIKGEDVYE